MTHPLIEEKRAEFVQKFATDNLWKDATEETAFVPVGNMEDWLRTALTEVYEAGQDHVRQAQKNRMMAVQDLPNRCPQCGEKPMETNMTYGELFAINAEWGRCFSCVSKDNNTSSNTH